jgi:hypothetical protein
MAQEVVATEGLSVLMTLATGSMAAVRTVAVMWEVEAVTMLLLQSLYF